MSGVPEPALSGATPCLRCQSVRDGCWLASHGGGGGRGREELTAQLAVAGDIVQFDCHRTPASWVPLNECHGRCQAPGTSQRTRPMVVAPPPSQI